MTDDKLYRSLSANITMAKLTYHFHWIGLVASFTGRHYSLDTEDGFLKVEEMSDHPIKATDTPGIKPFTMLQF